MTSIRLILIIYHIHFLNVSSKTYLVEEHSSGKSKFSLVNTIQENGIREKTANSTETDSKSRNKTAIVHTFRDAVVLPTQKDRLLKTNEKNGGIRRSSYGFRNTESPLPPKELTVHVRLGYEDSFLKQMGGNHDRAKEYIIQTVHPVKKYFLQEPLPIKIHLTFSTDIKYYRGYTWQIDDDDLEEIKEFQSVESRSPIIFFVRQPDGREHAGTAVQDGACQYNDGVALISWYPEIIIMSRHFAHELGHLLGMKHHYQQRFDSQGRDCYRNIVLGSGIMTEHVVAELPGRWSTCNGEQLLAWYKRWGHRCFQEGYTTK